MISTASDLIAFLFKRTGRVYQLPVDRLSAPNAPFSAINRRTSSASALRCVCDVKLSQQRLEGRFGEEAAPRSVQHSGWRCGCEDVAGSVPQPQLRTWLLRDHSLSLATIFQQPCQRGYGTCRLWRPLLSPPVPWPPGHIHGTAYTPEGRLWLAQNLWARLLCRGLHPTFSAEGKALVACSSSALGNHTEFPGI